MTVFEHRTVQLGERWSRHQSLVTGRRPSPPLYFPDAPHLQLDHFFMAAPASLRASAIGIDASFSGDLPYVFLTAEGFTKMAF
jgi:hypothetical protein